MGSLSGMTMKTRTLLLVKGRTATLKGTMAVDMELIQSGMALGEGDLMTVTRTRERIAPFGPNLKEVSHG